jgi:uncharacterized protein
MQATRLKAWIPSAAILVACAFAWTPAVASAAAAGVQLFPLSDVRLTAGPFFDAQQTDLHYVMELDPDRLLAPFLREAGLTPKKESYGNWESSGLDGHMGGHYLSALALMYASTGNNEVLDRLNYFVAELARAQEANGDGYLGGIPGGRTAFNDIAHGKLQADSFSVNGKWVPWYNLHKLFAGLRDAYKQAGNAQARDMLVALSDWALKLSTHLTPEQMQTMLRSEHGGMNEVLADVADMTGDKKYLDLAIRFSHQAVLEPLERQEDKLTGLHANTQIPKVIGFSRIGELTGQPDWERAARFFWTTVREHRTVAIGGNSVREHFHDIGDFTPMIEEVEGPETCNTYNMLKLTELLFEHEPRGGYADFYERALYNHILASEHPGTGGFVYFTPMRPNHYRVYSQVDKAMWCCVGSGIEGQARTGTFIYAHDADDLYVNLFIPSTLYWAEKNLQLTQDTRFPDESSSRITINDDADFTLKIRYPEWVAPGKLAIRINGRAVRTAAHPGEYVRIARAWRKGDRIDIRLPMTTRLEQMPDHSHYYAVLHGPIVLAAKTAPFADERLNFLAGDARMDHVPSGQVCPLEAAPMFISDTRDFVRKFKPVKGQPLTFVAPGLIRGKDAGNLHLIPFFRLHDSRYMIYWPYSTPADYEHIRAEAQASEAARLALDAITIDQVAPGEQQPESDHGFQGEDSNAGLNKGMHWRDAKGWFSYVLKDPKREAKRLRLTFSKGDAGRKFDVLINGKLVETIELDASASQDIYTRDVAIPQDMIDSAGGSLVIRFAARPGSAAGGLYGLRLLRQ